MSEIAVKFYYVYFRGPAGFDELRIETIGETSTEAVQTAQKKMEHMVRRPDEWLLWKVVRV